MTPASALLGVILALGGQAAAPLPFEELARKAAAARDKDQLDEAIRWYREGARLRPRWDEGLWYLATLLYEQDRFAEARDAFRRFLVLKPEAGPAWALQGMCEFKLKEYDAALRNLEKGTDLGYGTNTAVRQHDPPHRLPRGQTPQADGVIAGRRKAAIGKFHPPAPGAGQQPAAVGRAVNAGVVAGRDLLRTEATRAIEQRRELQIAVAVRAGQRRASGRVLAHEVRDDRLLELPLEIDDVVRKTESGGHAPRILEVVERAARAPRLLAAALIVELHRQTDDVMTLLGEQGRGDRGVDASRHGYNNSH